MSPSVTLLMAIHCHQPVGNFGFVFEEAYANAYDPFLRVLERHPNVRLSLHYSGSLLDWLLDHHPDFLKRVRGLVKRGQVEMLAGGYYEPILPLLPEADRQGQIAQMRAALRTHFGAEASGLWLTERVWEPELPETLARAGIRYTMMDTNQFGSAKPWLPQPLQVHDEAFWDVLGAYATEYAGSSVVLFPSSKRLRYWMPFQPVDRTIDFLKRLQRHEPAAITFADDGEKFGLWPKTHHWVYEEGWLDQLFSALERERSWLTTDTFHDYLEHSHPDGRVYLPCGSYEEMLEWSGGHFRNFFAKYPEANAMQQKMLRVSQELQSVESAGCGVRSSKAGRRRTRQHSPLATHPAKLLGPARQELYAGQCNCAYWHGVFGGLYLSHLRRAVYAHLLEAERVVHWATGERAALLTSDVDGDGNEELSLTTPTMHLVVDPDEGGTVTEWSVYGPNVNLLDTLSRRPEPYHEKLRTTPTNVAAATGAAPASIHDTLGTKEENLAAHLIYDDHRRCAFIDYALQRLPTLHEVVRATWGEQRLWSAGPFQWTRRASKARASRGLEVTLMREWPEGVLRKAIRVETRQPSVEYAYEVEGLSIPVVGLEFNVSLRDERYLTSAQEQRGAKRLTITEPGLSLSLTLDPPATLYHFPIETVSESEGGMERTYQGLCVVCLWILDGARAWTSRVQCALEFP